MAVSIIDMGEILKVFRNKTKQALKQASSLSLLCFRLESPSSLSLSSYMRWSSPFIILVSLCCALSSMCIPLFYWGRQIQAHDSRYVLKSGKERERITCRAYTQAIFQIINEAVEQDWTQDWNMPQVADLQLITNLWSQPFSQFQFTSLSPPPSHTSSTCLWGSYGKQCQRP